MPEPWNGIAMALLFIAGIWEVYLRILRIYFHQTLGKGRFSAWFVWWKLMLAGSALSLAMFILQTMFVAETPWTLLAAQDLLLPLGLGMTFTGLAVQSVEVGWLWAMASVSDPLDPFFNGFLPPPTNVHWLELQKKLGNIVE